MNAIIFFINNILCNTTRYIMLKFGLFKNSKFFKDYSIHLENYNKGRLSKEEVGLITNMQYNTGIPNSTKNLSKERANLHISDMENIRNKNELTPYQKGIMLLYDVLKQDESIKSVVNVGARVDIVSSSLSKIFPNVQFISVDFQSDLEEQNKYLPKSPNWIFKTGYALDLFDGGLIGDVVFFSSTCGEIRPKEMISYMEKISKFAKYVIINEPWHVPMTSFHPLKILSPSDIPYGEAEIGGCFRMGYVNYLHSYHKLLIESGYEILSSIISHKGLKYPSYEIQVVGVRK